MRALTAIALRELRAQIVSPVAWIVGTAYVFLAGYFFFGLVNSFAASMRSAAIYAQVYQNPSLLERINLNDLVVTGLFRNLLVLFLFILPVLTMRSFAEERKQGTDELLLTAPVSPGAIVGGKILGVGLVAEALVASSLVPVGVLFYYGDPEATPVWTGILGLALVVAALVPLGTAVSAATESQVAAAVGSFVVFLLLFVVDWPAETVGGGLASFLGALSLPRHYEPFSQGLVQSVDVVYFLSLAALGIFATRAVVASQRWR